MCWKNLFTASGMDRVGVQTTYLIKHRNTFRSIEARHIQHEPCLIYTVIPYSFVQSKNTHVGTVLMSKPKLIAGR